ncbi:ABC transporter B family member 15 isoform X1 [Vigna radiata var. radiata]|uniref:ABC transporter B family member 15 isoform X1 n=1 Tax=Vigna radiata var. radiata TaxID=3916 RepID=A0A1S3VME0_VIGRR|nr:ABC transporter B family member 15 isoform X1 [Vigna radiata var. radiata]
MGSKGGIFRYADGVDKFLLLFGTLGCIGGGLQTPMTMLVLGSLINDYEGGSEHSVPDQVIDKYALRLLGVAIGVALSSFIEGVCWTRTAERQTSRMRTEYLKSVLRQEVGFFDKQTDSSTTFKVIATITSDAQTIQDTMADKVPNCLGHLSAFFSSFIVALFLSWRLAVAAFPFSIMMIMPAIIFGKAMKELGNKMKDAYGVAGSIAEQAISSIRTVYSYVGEKQTMQAFNSSLEKSMEIGIKQGQIKGVIIGSIGLLYATWAFQSWVGSVLVRTKGESGGPVFCAEICIIWGGLSLMSALPNLGFILEATIATTRIFEMIDRVPSLNSYREKGKVLTHARGEITFQDVEFSYPSRPDALILQGLNLKVQAGKTLGLVGGSGSGKSTIISLLERFYDPVYGEILLDGYDIQTLHVKWLRSQMGLVNQEPILFATSIRENILFGKEGASMDGVIRAAKAANAHDFIVKLPDGYETQVGQFGAQLSGGQKQRIAIARALIREPKILLLDEATSALDSQSERLVQEALEKASRGRTTIIIAHRLSTIRKADSIVVLQSGRVVECGSHDELLQLNNGQGGAYRKMLQLQQATSQNEIALHTINKTSLAMENLTSPNSRWQSSPTHHAFSSTQPFSPIYSISVVGSSFDDYDRENFEKSSHANFSQWRLLRMNSPEWRHALLGCLGAIGSGICQPIYSYCLGIVASVYFIKDDSLIKSKIRLYSSIFCCIAVVYFISGLLQHYNFTIMGESLLKRVRENLLEKVLTFEMGWFDQEENGSAAICARLATEANLVKSLVAERMSLIVNISVMALLAFVLSLIVTWRVAIVMIAMQPLIIACFYSKNILMKSMAGKARRAQREGSQLAMEATVNHRTIAAFSSEKRILNLFRTSMEGPKKESIKQSWISGSILSVSYFVTTASITLTFWYGGRLLNRKLVDSKHLLQVFLILMGTGRQIAETASATSDIAKSGRAISAVFAILDRKSEIEPEDPRHRKCKSSLKGHIKLRDVFFSYPTRPDQMILKGLNLDIEAGKTVALVGQSGSGKSTIIGLIERFYDPMKGSICIDNCDIREFNLRSLRAHIALVSQEPTLFAGTIRDNIVYGKKDASEDEIRKAARLSNAHEFISSMKDGYDTYCGERGVQLSGGQKQRIAIARAVLKNPSILLLDEATSALDSVSENLVQEALEKMMVGRTCVVIAHRLSTIQNVDSIVVIQNGKVVEQGSHSELLRIGSNGAYYSLTRLQQDHST